MARPIDKGATFVTGGDVSRFQRTTVPPQRGEGRQDYTPAGPGVSAKVNDEPVYKGPSVRVTRGKATEETPVSAQAAVGGAVGNQANAVRRAGQTAPLASPTLNF
jgi:pilus assembly protein CpaB